MKNPILYIILYNYTCLCVLRPYKFEGPKHSYGIHIRIFLNLNLIWIQGRVQLVEKSQVSRRPSEILNRRRWIHPSTHILTPPPGNLKSPLYLIWKFIFKRVKYNIDIINQTLITVFPLFLLLFYLFSVYISK